MRFGSAPMVVNGSMSGSITSHGIDLQQDWIYSIQAIWNNTGTEVSAGAGSLNLQISNDNVPIVLSGPSNGTDPAVNVVNWTNYSGSFSSVSATAGTSSFMWNVLYPGYHWVRAVYTASSGTGVMNINFFGKGQ